MNIGKLKIIGWINFVSLTVLWYNMDNFMNTIKLNSESNNLPHQASPHVVNLRLPEPKPPRHNLFSYKALLARLLRVISGLGFMLIGVYASIKATLIDVARTFGLPLKLVVHLYKKTEGKILGLKTTLVKNRKNATYADDYFELASLEVKQAAVESDELLRQTSGFGLRPWLGFVTVLFVLTLPFKSFSYFKSLDDLKDKIIGSSTLAINDLKKASESVGSMNFKDASQDFSQASASFLSAKKELEQINSFFFELAKLVPNDQVQFAASSQHILLAGELGAKIGADLSLAIDGLLSGKEEGILSGLEKFQAYGMAAQKSAELLSIEMSQINEANLPAEYRGKFSLLKGQANFLSGNLKAVVSLVDKIKILLGTERDTRYLLAFQNNAEMRASGGFFGSYALIDFSKGKIKNIETPAGGTYDVEASYKERIIAPTPLWLVNPLWHFWDANWWYDWPTTAKKLMWFYEKSGGPTVDGIISLTPTVIENVLQAIGPIDMQKDYGMTVTADNFWQVAQTLAEQKPDVTNKPKKIIGDLMLEIKNQLPHRLNQATLFGLLKTTEQSLNEKHILFYFKNEELEQFITDYGWDGRVKNSNYDYLAVINTNIGGGKSDRKITQTVNHRATIMSDGSIIDDVEIIRRNNASSSELFTGVRNVDWLRVYVPNGSELIEATGFNSPKENLFEQPEAAWTFDDDLTSEDKSFRRDELSNTKIYQEFGKTVFANWLMVDPGQEVRAHFKYKLSASFINEIKSDLPDGISALLGSNKKVLTYALMVQKQPGAQRINFTSSVNIQPLAFSMPMSKTWQSQSLTGSATSDLGWQASSDLITDQYWAALFEQKD